MEIIMNKVTKNIFIFLLLFIVSSTLTLTAVRVKDMAYIHGVRNQQLIGYGIVVGLNGTGDTHRSTFTVQSVSSMLKRFGITVSQNDLRLRNAAAVMITAAVPNFAKEGGLIDVVVSSIGDATSLQGGTLLMAPLSGTDGLVYATAQGSISTGGTSVRQSGNEIRRNHTAAGRVPGGAIMERSFVNNVPKDTAITIVLTQADFTSAIRIAEAVNKQFLSNIAIARDASNVTITIPPDKREDGKIVEFISSIELLEVTPDVTAKVVLNERTGTVVIGERVTILPVAITHGQLNIEIQSSPVISQPQPFSQGETVVTQMTTLSAQADTSRVVAFDGAATVQDVAKTLNALKVTPRDIIAIFQALKEAGALKAELIIL